MNAGVPLALEVPAGATLTKTEGSSMLTLPGIMASIYLVDSLTPPTLGMLAERGEDGMKQDLIASGITASKAAKMVRDARKVMQHARVVITPVRLGDCSGKKYSFHMPVQTVHHYCLTLADRHVLVTATQFQTGASALPVLEEAIATLRLEPS
jgi:hypothetical protein